ncbi:MAG: hypothetical protein U0821_23605 [Chloroflexota bacterium]
MPTHEAQVWLNDVKAGPFTGGRERGWTIVDGLRAGENALVAVSRPEVSGQERGLRLVVRQESSGEDLAGAGIEVSDTEEPATTVYVSRIWGT